jgi:uncharacterized membrane protein
MRSRPQNDRARPRPPNVTTRRLEAFSDAVFAIAITLLALDLQVPELSPVTPNALAADLAAKWPTYLSFLLSFVTLLIAWIYHHRLLEAAKHAGTGLLFINGLLLLVVAAVPFPTALLGAYLTTPAASVVAAIYAGYIGVLNFTYNVLWWVVVRQQRTEYREGWRPPQEHDPVLSWFPVLRGRGGDRLLESGRNPRHLWRVMGRVDDHGTHALRRSALARHVAYAVRTEMNACASAAHPPGTPRGRELALAAAALRRPRGTLV